MRDLKTKHLGVEKIISGGQTGADRGGLDAAMTLEIPHGGFCPKNRKAEDGRIPLCYGLTELADEDYLVRTKRNITSSGATIVFTRGVPERGSRATIEYALKFRVPVFTVDLNNGFSIRRIRTWLRLHKPSVLNVAGNRESVSPGIQATVHDALVGILDA